MISGSTVYIGGAFTKFAAETTRERIAAICATANCEGEVAAGKATAWNPVANKAVDTLVVFGATVYAGGEFTKLGGATRERIGAICATAKCEGEVAAGKATAWNPKANGSVEALAISGSTMYVGGVFTEVGGSTREHIAAVCATAKCEGEVAAGKATAWNPKANGTVEALATSGSTIYAGGVFTESVDPRVRTPPPFAERPTAKANSLRAKPPRGTPAQTAASLRWRYRGYALRGRWLHVDGNKRQVGLCILPRRNTVVLDGSRDAEPHEHHPQRPRPDHQHGND